MVNNLEEITIHELNRRGDALSEDMKTLKENIKPEDKELDEYIVLYTNMIKTHNKFIRETNSYLRDHIVRYYMDKSTGDLTYSKRKRMPIGF